MKTTKIHVGNIEYLVIGDCKIYVDRAKKGKMLNNPDYPHPYYAEKLKVLDDETWYIYDIDVKSPNSIYAYCDYLILQQKFKGLT